MKMTISTIDFILSFKMVGVIGDSMKVDGEYHRVTWDNNERAT